MNRNLTKRILSAILTLCLFVSSAPIVLAEDSGEPDTALPEKSETQTQAAEKAEEPNKDLDLIKYANGLANGTQTAYSSTYRDTVTITNRTMSLDYGVQGSSKKMYVQHLSNTKGKAYITNTMDVFVKTTDGNKYFASGSIDSAKLNIYRYGYYYYENRIEGQNFFPDIKVVNSERITSDPNLENHISNLSSVDGQYSYTITGSDPYICFSSSVSASDYNYVKIEVKATQVTENSQLFIKSGSHEGYSEDRSRRFALASDGEYHTYYIPLSLIPDYTGTLKEIRFDINGAVGSQVYIKSIEVIKSQDFEIDPSLSIQRSFLTYSNKMHHLVQFSTLKEIPGIDEVGMETKIAADTVNALVVKDASGLKYSLDGVDWATAEYVGFDIKDAGIFGYILPADGKSGKLNVTLEDGNYIITQTLPVDKFTPSCIYDSSKTGKEAYTAIVPLNGNDVFFGQRIYNDETHDFKAFIYEAECERHPLTEENIIVDYSENGAGFAGYDPLYGFYKFTINGFHFNAAYYDHPNRHVNVRFTVKGDDKNRNMYFMTRCSNSGCLESAVLLDDRDMILPIPLEVAKNFGSDGENTKYNYEDRQYGETFFPMIVNAGETRTYNVINLYQNWGRFPLKQISSIQFHQPYYHLSTGATETNCIVPYPLNGPGLPDHRAMSAPFWTGQPQHNSGGGHSFLRYTDASGVTVSSRNTTGSIDSYGPTYCDLTLDYVTSDGKVTAEYTHTEMPQIDENRAYYEMKYTFKEDVSFNDFRNDFTFYRVTDNNATGVYQKLGYLDTNNQSQVEDAEHSSTVKGYVLGKNCPYFSFFMMPDWNRESKSAQGYTNLSMLFKDWKVVINGEEYVPNLYIRNQSETVYLSMDLGEVSFKAGDTITINAILMPWGSQQMEDEEANRLENAQTAIYTSPHYSDVLPDGTLYMDKNVRDVRINTLLNPLTATEGENCEKIESAFVPKLKSTNGQSATFTVSGGYDNNTVRVYGFNKLTVPYIEEFVDGEWVEYEVSSANARDQQNYGHPYDGYMAYYDADADGTYSYSFVFNMTDKEPRTFRISAVKDFNGWSYDPDVVVDKPMNIYIGAESLAKKATDSFFEKREVMDSGSYVRLYPKSTTEAKKEDGTTEIKNITESYINAYSGGTTSAGKYIVYKYRVPTTNSKNTIGRIDFWTSTESTGAGGNDNITLESSVVQIDGNWHVMVVDVTKLKQDACTYAQNEYGEYVPRYLRVDVTNTQMQHNDYVDVAYVGFSDSLAEIIAANKDVATVDVINTDKTSYTPISTANYTVSSDALKVSFQSELIFAGTDTFTLDLKLTGNNGLNFLRVIPQFDTEKFELINIENGELFSQMSQLDGSVIWNVTDVITEDGTLARFTFKAKTALAAGRYSFGVKTVDAFSNKVTEVISFSESTTLRVTNDCLFGDCNGDTKIDLADVILLREYLVNLDPDTGISSVEIRDGADANGNGTIDSNDLILLRQYLANYDYANKKPGIVLGPQN